MDTTDTKEKKKKVNIKDTTGIIYNDRDYETPDLIYEIVRTKAPKDPRFEVTWRRRDENKEGSVGVFVLGAGDKKSSFGRTIENTAKIHIEVTSYKGVEGENRTAVYLNNLMHRLENDNRSPISLIKIKHCRHLSTGPVFIKNNQFGSNIYTLDIEITYLFKSEE